MGLTRIRAEQISNIDYKQAVRAVTTTNVNLSGGAPVVVDGVTLVQGNRVLVTGQSTGSQNGIYVVQTLGTGEDGTWIRATDANATGEIEPGMVVMVTEGTTYADTPWKLTTNGTIIIGTTPLVFQQFSSGANIGGVDTNIQFNSSGNLAGSNNLTWDGAELYVNAAANITGNVSGNYFFGNGSQLSGIITSVANINNGDSNVSIDSANADITMSVNGTANVVVVSATGLTVNGNITGNGIPTTTVANTAPATPEQGDIWINSDTGTQYIYFTSGGNSQWAEMEADLSIGGGGSEVDLTAVSSNILPTANITYDIGNTTNRFRDIYLANSTIYLGEAEISATDGAIVLPANTTVGGAVVTPAPKVTGFTYPGDDTAANPAGGQTILINGANFESGCVVYLDNAVISPVVFVSSSQLSFTSPAKATGTYSVYVVNPDGTSALALPGIIYSGVPTWSTAAGSLGTPYETNFFISTLVATADSAVTYAASPGNTLPANLTLNSSTGNLTGTVPATNNDTTYTFSVRATDAEQQDTDRQFSVTYKVDVVTWDSPANAASYTWPINIANSLSMTATSAAGKSVSFAVQSGSLPANVAISGNLITGTPNAIQANTSVVIRATAATTNRFADRTLYFTTINPSEPWTLTAAPTQLAVTNNRTLTNYNNLPNTYPEVQISPDGTKLSVWDDANSNFMMYDLSPANTLGTLPSPYVNGSGLGGSRLAAFYWKPDGMANIQIWWDLGRCYRYDVGSAWNPGSYSAGSIYTGGWASAFSSRITGLYMSSDGTKAFIAGDNKVALYTMSSPWVVNGLTYNSQFVVPNTDWVLKVFFKSDGTRMFVSVISGGVYQIRQYNLGTAWNLSTASLANTFVTTDYNNAGAIGLSFTSDGTKMYTGAFATNTAVRIWNTDA